MSPKIRHAAVIGAISAIVLVSLAGAQTGPAPRQNEAVSVPLTVQAAAAQTPAVSLQDALQFCLDGIVTSGVEDLEGLFVPMALQQLFPGVGNITTVHKVVKSTSTALRIGVRLETGDIIDAEFEIARLVTTFAGMSKNPFIKAWGLIGTPALYCAQAGFVLIGATGFQVGQSLRSVIFPEAPGGTPAPEGSTTPPDPGPAPPADGSSPPPDTGPAPPDDGSPRPPDVDEPAPPDTDGTPPIADTPPDAGSAPPDDGTTTPPDTGSAPPDGGAPPDSGPAPPDDGTTPPPDPGPAPPDTGPAPPDDGTTPPPDDDEPAPPDTDGTPPDGGAPPDSGPAPPDDGTTAPPDDDEPAPPDTDVSPPDAEAPPDTGPAPPDAGSGPPDSGTAPPDGGTTDPPFVCLGPQPADCQP